MAIDNWPLYQRALFVDHEMQVRAARRKQFAAVSCDHRYRRMKSPLGLPRNVRLFECSRCFEVIGNVR